MFPQDESMDPTVAKFVQLAVDSGQRLRILTLPPRGRQFL